MNDLLLLALLLRGPQHGYALKKQAGLMTGQPDMHNNLVYPLLRRFVRQGWVTQKRVAGERGQTRQVYSLTPLGRRTLVARLCDFDETAASSSDEFRVRVGLLPMLDPPARSSILEKRAAYLRKRAERFDPLQRAMEIGKYGGEVVRFIRQQISAELAWIGKLRRMERGPRRKAATKKE
ncbi:MAG: helix-turn-helix transcriptional regulator [Candidatus Acidiferrales bacterium]